MNGDPPDWDTPPATADHRDPAAGLATRIAAARDYAAATLGRAETTDRIHCPARLARDPELVQIHAEAGRFFQSRLARSWVPDYLATRGLAAALLPTSPWKIGYAPAQWTALTDYLRHLGHSDTALLRSGVITTGKDGRLRDRFHDRLMIPLRAEDRAVIAFIGRRHPDAGDDHGPKYLNSPDTDMFIKGHVLAGLAEGRRPLQTDAQPVLVEGPLDAIAVSIAAPGEFVGITPCGTALTSEQVAALARVVSLPDRGLRVALDADTAGRKAAVRAYDRLAPVTSNLTAVSLPDGQDPAQILQEHGRTALRDALAAQTRPPYGLRGGRPHRGVGTRSGTDVHRASAGCPASSRQGDRHHARRPGRSSGHPPDRPLCHPLQLASRRSDQRNHRGHRAPLPAGRRGVACTHASRPRECPSGGQRCPLARNRTTAQCSRQWTRH
jgi:DNA primase catalytic core, N-terminal domain/Toprim-like